MNAAIAQKLNILESAILEVREWAHVLLVRFVGGCRFVSKKVKAMESKAMQVPETEEEAMKMGVGRGFDWNEEIRQLVIDILQENREVDIMGKVDPYAKRVRELTGKGYSRVMMVVGNMATKLGAKVINY